ncbi:hypothetical protein SLEP1_g31102 [Rubroshorea leprosula]|uniref:Uncharacterized protein n=1 Tax=Rubroshorea leprosula TaxID=152421 RepID=A0AAV5KB32_9ROSI|nr:hypothetical protein SLEP1_g31102 [Rubroshorea leprosula]
MPDSLSACCTVPDLLSACCTVPDPSLLAALRRTCCLGRTCSLLVALCRTPLCLLHCAGLAFCLLHCAGLKGYWGSPFPAGNGDGGQNLPPVKNPRGDPRPRHSRGWGRGGTPRFRGAPLTSLSPYEILSEFNFQLQPWLERAELAPGSGLRAYLPNANHTVGP